MNRKISVWQGIAMGVAGIIMGILIGNSLFVTSDVRQYVAKWVAEVINPAPTMTPVPIATPKPEAVIPPGYDEISAAIWLGTYIDVSVGRCSDGKTCAVAMKADADGKPLKYVDLFQQSWSSRPMVTRFELKTPTKATVEVTIDVRGGQPIKATWQVNENAIYGPTQLGKTFVAEKIELLRNTVVTPTMMPNGYLKVEVATLPTLTKYLRMVSADHARDQWGGTWSLALKDVQGGSFISVLPIPEGFATAKAEFELPDIDNGGAGQTVEVKSTLINSPLVTTEKNLHIYTSPSGSDGYVNIVATIGPSPIVLDDVKYQSQYGYFWVKIIGRGWVPAMSTNVTKASIDAMTQVYSFK